MGASLYAEKAAPAGVVADEATKRMDSVRACYCHAAVD